MSDSQLSRREYALRTIDLAIRELLNELRGDRTAQAAFRRLVVAVRSRSSLLKLCDGVHAAFRDPILFLRGLFSLARNGRFWIRSPEDWLVSGESRLSEFSSLVHWLLANDSVPPFMLHVWLLEPSPEARYGQTLYRHLARGFSIRGADTPFAFTKRMERSFLNAPDDCSLDAAFEWARRCRVQKPKLKSENSNRQITRRRRKRQVVNSSRLLHREWAAIPISNFRTVDPPAHEWSFRSWSVNQILNSTALRQEGLAMHHCVSTYEWLCQSGRTSIWSMKTHGTLSSRHVLTIEIAPRKRQIIQAKGRFNAPPSAEARRVMMKWAERERLSIATYV